MIDIIELNLRLPRKKGVYYLPMDINHLKSMNVPPDQMPWSRAIPVETMLEAQARLGLAVTAMVENKPVAMFGCVLLWRGVAEMWSIISDEARCYPKQLTIVAKEFSDIAVQSLALHRLQITVRSDEPRALRWAEFLGFKNEGLLTKYSPDKVDTYILARV